jgi:hypothetical protein
MILQAARTRRQCRLAQETAIEGLYYVRRSILAKVARGRVVLQQVKNQ